MGPAISPARSASLRATWVVNEAAAEIGADQIGFAARYTIAVRRGLRVYKFQQSWSRAQR